jgi:serine/threonine-protein kinase
VGTPTSSGLRFRVLRPHAQGGLGQVSVALDAELGRHVALKEIQPDYADDPASQGRFLLEAEVTGNLEHPGVVPVYGLGRHPDGRPYYAMRFVRGESLQDAIRRFHQAETPGRDPGERALALRGLLRRFVDVCNAVAYAHSRGVLHRDLKPANVMLGPYGETLVVDWGLAKPVGRPEGVMPTEEGTLRPARAGGPAATQAGAAVGTPGYMSPEQAAGQADALGPASDVYSLGATLYCLLTGRAPVEDPDPLVVLVRAQLREFPPPRRLKPDVPAALDAVCHKAMAHNSRDRYPGALDLAADVEHWLADEPVGAWQEPWRVRAGRWVRRHKPQVAALAATALVALLLGGAGLWWVQRQAEQRRQGIEAALAKAAEMRGQARWAEAHAVLEQAADRLGAGGPGDLRQRLERARSDLDLVARLDAIQLKRVAWVEGRFNNARVEQEYAATFREVGLGEVGENPNMVAARVRASGVRHALVDALDDWAVYLDSGARLNWVLGVVRRADPDPWRDRVRNAKAWTDLTRLGRLASVASARLAAEAPARGLSPRFAAFIALRLYHLGGDAEGLLRAALARRPGDFWVNFVLGDTLYRRKKQTGEAVGFYRAALALRPDVAAVHNDLGNALCALHKRGEAVAEYRRAIQLDSKLTLAHYNLGHALYAQGKLAEAVAAYRRAIQLEPRYAEAHNDLGLALNAQGKPGEAVAEYHRAIHLKPKLVQPHYNLGQALYAQGKLAEAVAEHRRAIELNPKNAPAHTNLGLALYAQGKLPEAVAEHRRAIELDPKLALAHNNFGLALYAQGKLDEAVAAYRQAIQLDPKDAQAHTNLGVALADQGQLSEAVAEHRWAIQMKPKLALAHTNLGNALQAQGKLPEAVAEYHRAIQLEPKLALAHYNLGRALYALGKLDGAVAAYCRAIHLDPNHAESHCNLGEVLRQQGRLQESRDCYRRGHELGSRRRDWRYQSGQWVKEAERLADLERALPAFLKGERRPQGAAESLELAQVCRLKGLFAGAARFYGEAFAEDPKQEVAHRCSAACNAALAGAGQAQDAADLNAEQRTDLRRQARAWLRADLARWAKQLEGGTALTSTLAQQTLHHWQRDRDLAGVRDAAALNRLPEAERLAWQHLWTDVASMDRKARKLRGPPGAQQGWSRARADSAPEVFEAEDLGLLHWKDCSLSVQHMAAFGAEKWGKGRQLLGKAFKGAWVELALPVERPGEYALGIYFTRAADFGRIEVSVDGSPVGQVFDGFAAKVAPSGRIPCGAVRLKKGIHRLRFRVTGKHLKSTAYNFGVDRVVLSPREQP